MNMQPICLAGGWLLDNNYRRCTNVNEKKISENCSVVFTHHTGPRPEFFSEARGGFKLQYFFFFFFKK